MSKRISLAEIMKPTTMTCINCGGVLHVIPYYEEIGKNKFDIKTINLCGVCSFKEHTIGV